MKTVIVTADDFGAAEAVNEAVEVAHTQGCLTAASLMVTGDAVDDAVARARRLPGLGVGLHLVLVEGRPALPPQQIPDLVGPDGMFRTDMARTGVDIFFRPAVRRQLRAEVEAQFARFAATGLPLDHVNAHKHFHLHPTIAATMIEVGKRYGLKASRAPVEPVNVIAAIELTNRNATTRIADIWARRLRGRFRRQGIVMADQVFGLAWSGAMTTARVAALAARLPDGVSEIYFHPGTRDDFPGHAPGYRYADELAALTSPGVKAALEASGARLARSGDLAA
ncbi:hopanoid biosynthesis-associated protein HpnK [Sphingomonas sp. GlSt437]|uniref:hopanoid biosynthesis-associated protein HpnK n=1 Tax=Sphingomonas sp. GlSt437 TaxID=3389970 RepID=UPI003A8862CE